MERVVRGRVLYIKHNLKMTEKTMNSANYHLGKLEGFATLQWKEGNIGEETYDSLMQSVKIIERALPLPY